MPIGKNSIKRVANNGYSSVKSEAPDMENSSVIPNTSPEVMEMVSAMAEPKKKPAAKKEKPKPKVEQKPAKPAEEVSAEFECPYVSVGDDMPIYLL